MRAVLVAGLLLAAPAVAQVAPLCSEVPRDYRGACVVTCVNCDLAIGAALEEALRQYREALARAEAAEKAKRWFGPAPEVRR